MILPVRHRPNTGAEHKTERRFIMNITLKENIDLIAFFKIVNTNCTHDIFLHTSEGDCLNLRSTLSQYIFAMITKDHFNLAECFLTCDETDAPVLQDFFAR